MQRLQRVTTARRTQVRFKKPLPEFWNPLGQSDKSFRPQHPSPRRSAVSRASKQIFVGKLDAELWASEKNDLCAVISTGILGSVGREGFWAGGSS
jgi:hypothetical protein